MVPTFFRMAQFIKWRFLPKSNHIHDPTGHILGRTALILPGMLSHCLLPNITKHTWFVSYYFKNKLQNKKLSHNLYHHIFHRSLIILSYYLLKVLTSVTASLLPNLGSHNSTKIHTLKKPDDTNKFCNKYFSYQ